MHILLLRSRYDLINKKMHRDREILLFWDRLTGSANIMIVFTGKILELLLFGILTRLVVCNHHKFTDTILHREVLKVLQKSLKS